VRAGGTASGDDRVMQKFRVGGFTPLTTIPQFQTPQVPNLHHPGSTRGFSVSSCFGAKAAKRFLDFPPKRALPAGEDKETATGHSHAKAGFQSGGDSRTPGLGFQ
jgi:hypothetical protein